MKYNENDDEMVDKLKKYIAISNFCEENNVVRTEEYPQIKKIKKWKEKFMKKRIIITTCAGIMLVSGMVFATDIGSFIKNFFGANSSDGVDIAVNNGYISNVDMEYQKVDGIEIKVDSILIDDYNFDMNFNVKVDDDLDIKESNSIEFTDLRIIDEQNNLVFDHHSYLEGNNDEEVKTGEHYEGSYSFLVTKINNNELQISLSATGNTKPFPKSKKIFVDFTKILSTTYENEQYQYKGYEGNWHFEIDVPEEFYNRKTDIYKAIKCNDPGIELQRITAKLSNTAFKIAIPEINSNKINYRAEYDGISIYNSIELQKEYVETSDGKKFETSQRSDGDGGYGIPKDEEKIINYSQTFNLTKYDATDNIKVHIFTNKGEEIIIEFERK